MKRKCFLLLIFFCILLYSCSTQEKTEKTTNLRNIEVLENKWNDVTLINITNLKNSFLTLYKKTIGKIQYLGNYYFKPKVSGIYKIYTTGTTNTIGSLYSEELIEITENEDKSGDEFGNFEINMELTKNKTYYVKVSSRDDTGLYCLCIDKIVNTDSIKQLELDTTYSAKHGDIEQWYIFIPEEVGSYKIAVNGNENIKCMLYDEKFNLIMEDRTSLNSNDYHEIANTLLKGKKYFIEIILPNEKIEYKLVINNLKEPNDLYFKDQWALLNTSNGLDINIIPAWQYLSGQNFKIGIADTGVDYNHVDLNSNLDLSLSFNFTHNIKDIFPVDERISDLSAKWGHGTQVTGIIASEINNNEGIAGIAPNLDIISLKVLGSNLKNSTVYNDSVVAFINAIEYAEQNNIKIINCSFDGANPSIFEQEAMANADDILFIIAAGNVGNDLFINPEYPACYYLNNSVVVAATNQNGELAEFSNYGGPTDIAAPGENIISTIPNNGYICDKGTSLATPIVAAVAGLVWSNNKDLTPIEVKDIIIDRNNVTKLDSLVNKVKSGGMINAYKSLTYKKSNIVMTFNRVSQYNENEKIRTIITNLQANTNNITNQVIVKFNSKVNINKFICNITNESSIKTMNQIGYLPSINAFVFQFTDTKEAKTAIKILNNNNNVLYAESNYLRY